MREIIANQINFDIRQILPPVVDDISNDELTNNIHINQYLEKAHEINELNLGNAGNLSEELSYILDVDDNNLRGIGYASVAGIHTYNGNYKKALIGLNKALSLKVSNDVQAYIFTEYANLLRLLKRTDEALAIFDRASDLTVNESLKWRINTYIGYTLKFIDSDKTLKILSKSADYYLKNDNLTRYLTVLRHIGATYSGNLEYRKAKRYFNTILKIALENELNSIASDVRSDLGWILFKEQKYIEARNIYNDLITTDLDTYSLSLVYQNYACLEFELENYREAINLNKKSFAITFKNDMSEMLYEDYYKIGLSYEKLGDYSNSIKYYREGYLKLQEEREELGIILNNGYRKSLIDNYIRFLENKPSIDSASLHPETFNFTDSKVYTEILDVFQENLLRIHRRRHKTIEQLCDSLDISLRLYFVYQNRFGLTKSKMMEMPELNPHFENYLFSLADLDWKTAKNQFDNDLYKYLLSKYSYNKTKLAEILDVSNLTVIKKTANIK